MDFSKGVAPSYNNVVSSIHEPHEFLEVKDCQCVDMMSPCNAEYINRVLRSTTKPMLPETNRQYSDLLGHLCSAIKFNDTYDEQIESLRRKTTMI